MALIDTCVIIDMSKGIKRALDCLEKLEAEGESLKVSSISIFELANGLNLGIEEKRRQILNSFQIVPFDFNHAEVAGVIDRNLKNSGKEIQVFDSMIAATALIEKERIITANKKHFERIDGLEIISY